MRLNPQGQAAYLLRGWGTYHLIPKFQHLKAGEYLAGPALSWSRSVIALGSRVRTRSAVRSGCGAWVLGRRGHADWGDLCAIRGFGIQPGVAERPRLPGVPE